MYSLIVFARILLHLIQFKFSSCIKQLCFCAYLCAYFIQCALKNVNHIEHYFNINFITLFDVF